MKTDYRILDAHCDTVTELSACGGELYKNSLHLDAVRMREYGAYLQFFAAWVDDAAQTPFADCMACADTFERELAKNPSIVPVLSARDAQRVFAEGKIGAMLTVENGYALEAKAENLQTLWERGVRAMTITWNGQNELCTGCMAEADTGLTPFGRDVIAEMNRLGMLVDVSHASENGFWDIVRASRTPVFASHSNSFSVYAHPRNLKDEQIRAVAERGGVIGLNLYPAFLSDKQVDLTDCVRHIRHIMNVGGEDCIGLGSDFDGVEMLPQGIRGAQDYEALFACLTHSGFTDGQIEKITYQNFLRYLAAVL